MRGICTTSIITIKSIIALILITIITGISGPKASTQGICITMRLIQDISIMVIPATP
jgi:hypothetical protein